MGVDIQTYRARIGTYKHSHGPDVEIKNNVINSSDSLKIVGSVLFIGTLLIMAGVEQNPGPRESDEGQKASSLLMKPEDAIEIQENQKANEELVHVDSKQSISSPQEEFDALKQDGNELFNQSKFKEAIECYNKCEVVLPGQVVIYTNRALCYIRTHQPKNAEEDCSKALSLEKDNVKALLRRAQARKVCIMSNRLFGMQIHWLSMTGTGL